MAIDTHVTTSEVLHWVGTHLAKYRWQVAGAIIALFIAAGAWLLLGQGIKLAVDEGFIENNPAILNKAVAGVLVICFIASIATYFRFYLMSFLGERISADIRNQVFSHLLTLTPSFFAKTRTGEVISRFTSDTTVLQTVIGSSVSMAVRSAVTFIGAIVLMAITSPILTLCVLLAVPAVLLPLRLLAPRVRKYARESQDRIADLGAHVDQALHEITTVQAFNAQLAEIMLFSQRVGHSLHVAKKRIRYRSQLIGAIMLVSLAAITLIAWVGARQVFAAEMSMGELSAFLFYAVLAGGSVATISEVIGDVQRGVGASERLLQLLHTAPLIQSGSQPLLIEAHKPPPIRFEKIRFAYPDNPVLFNSLSLTVHSGEKVALVGPSGAGKTSLFQLLLRFYEPQHGQIKIGSQPINQVRLTDLRNTIAIVTQDPVIFAATVYENIAYGNPEADIEDIVNAAKAAFADEFIEQLESGYQTQLGERGVRLSGGQRQRIAIARAILANRPILLLDEATSALDARSEQMVQHALSRLMQGRTTIVIAHRLATVQHADRIVVMEKGSIKSSGTHQELLESDALYREYAELQLLS
ncbi:ABC transporter transmembrane domain-containing protein [Alteromonas ponticola]|uniref:ABC transporter transmembrane domain-containing protein n=1 Tax=Alteromonas aquimaris TaxID=2998417 RepID=A0ABT3P4V2_9ALTE|nr:ABC transporter transmembrane domain-containing protein [Alteromonas aquimaris]MCW8107803.1 ABC transporter transmembrane domain-containing protein [Alteromonas aquimaris]